MEPNTLTQKTEKQVINSFTLDDQFVIFTLDEHYFALPVSIVERIVRSVIITTVPGTPENVLGVINFKGQVIPVFNLRRMFGFASGEIQLSDQLIIARTSKRTISFVADMVTGVTDRMEQKTVPADKIFPGMEKIIEGLVFFEDGMILIYDLEKLFTLESIEVINLALMEQEKKEVHDVKEQVVEKIQKPEEKVEEKIQEPEKKAEKKIQAPKEITAKEKEIKDKKEDKTVKKKQEPKKTPAKRVKASGKKTIRKKGK